jgi:hypothetical protein
MRFKKINKFLVIQRGTNYDGSLRTMFVNNLTNRNRYTLLFLCLFLLPNILLSQTYTFTSAGATGRFGPTQTQLNTAYASTNLNGAVTTTNGIQFWTVPSSGPYRIETRGAKGGNGSSPSGGPGAIMRGDFTLTAGQVLKVLVGQVGGNADMGGGGGGSYVTNNSNTAFCIAGGGGGGAYLNVTSFGSVNATGTVGTSGQAGINGNASVTAGPGGTLGAGGGTTTTYSAGVGSGGGGLNGNGANGNPSTGGLSFINGGTGGLGASTSFGTGGDGGFGGGGGGEWTNWLGAGGAGGYSGGGGGVVNGWGGGGGSFNSGSNQLNSSGTNSTTGLVIITKLSGINIIQTASVSCSGQSVAALSATAFGGAAPYTYTWLPINATTSAVSGLAAGVYTCSALDASLVAYSATFAIIQPPLLTPVIASQTNVSCNGGSNGAISVSTTGGTGAYSFTWSPSGGNSPLASNLSAGNYTLTIKDINNCTSSLTTAITQATPFVISGFATSPTVCLGGTSILLGAGAISYTWSGGVTNGVSFTPTSSTNYTLSGTNSNGCIASTVTPITVNPLPSISISGSNSVCAGSTLTLTASGANTYSWSNSTNSASISISPTINTSYTVIGTNSNGCSNVATKTISITNLPILSINASSLSVCQGNTIILLASGATSYTWSNGISNGLSFTPTLTTTYSVSGQNNCGTATNTITVSVVPLPVLTVSISQSLVCAGSTVVLIGSGASTYTWSGGVTNATAFTPSASNTYTLSGSNACGNTTATAFITVNALPLVNANASSLSVCLGGTVNLQGTGAITYTWTGGITNSVPFTPSSTASYSLSGTDANGCVNSVIKTVVVNTIPVVTAITSNSVVCFGNSTTLNGSGASTYSWTGGVNNNVAFTPTATTAYTVVGANSCGTGTAIVSVTVNPLPNVAAIAVNPSICVGGTTALQGSGAQSYLWTGGVSNNVAFSPTASATYFVIGTDVNTCQNSASASITVNTLPTVSANASSTLVCLGNTLSLSGAGATTYTWSGGVNNAIAFSPTVTNSYSVTGTDNNGCKNNAVVTISVATVPLISANSSSPAICVGGTTTLFGGGASTYSWTSAVINNSAFTPTVTANYTVTGSTACGTSTAAITVTVNSLPLVFAIASPSVVCAGNTLVLLGGGATTYTWTGGVLNNTAFTPSNSATYTLTGTNANGCKNTALQAITVNPLPVVIANASSTFICMGNTLSLSGGGADTYVWSGAVINNSAFTPSLTNTYAVTGTNTVTGCANTASRTVTVNALPTVTASSSLVQVCAGNSITLSGLGANTYTWTGGVINNSAFVPVTTTTYSVNGTNTLTGCTSTNNAFITVTVNARPTVSLTASNLVVCLGQTTALNANGADTYSITGGYTPTQVFSPTVTANYTLIGTNTLSGCTSTNIASQTITVNPLPSVAVVASSSAVCIGNTVSLSGSNANTYTWSGGILNGVAFTPSISNTYTVTGTNTLTGCVKTNTQLLVVNVLPTVALTNSALVICAGTTVSLTATGADTYTWSGGIVNALPFIPLSSANYTVTGTNTLTGCSNTAPITATITVNALPSVSVSANATAVCSGAQVILNGIGSNTYSWTNGVLNGISFTPSVTNNYTGTVTNTLTNCSNTVVQTIVVNTVPIVSISASTASVCAGGIVALTASGANTYTWSNGVPNGVPFTPNSTLTYTVIGTNTVGACSNVAVKTVTVFALPTLSLSASTNSVCAGTTVVLVASGANTYTWSGGFTNNLPFTPSATQSYSVTGTNTLSGCTSTNISAITISVLPLPGIFITTATTSLCVGETLSLTANAATSYTWSTGVTGLQMIETPTVAAVYNYSVVGRDANGCENTASATQTVFECTSIEKSELVNNLISVFPNPSNGTLFITSNFKISLFIYNETGQLLRTIDVDGEDKKVVIESLANGVYLIYGYFNKQIIRHKVIVQK